MSLSFLLCILNLKNLCTSFGKVILKMKNAIYHKFLILKLSSNKNENICCIISKLKKKEENLTWKLGFVAKNTALINSFLPTIKCLGFSLASFGTGFEDIKEKETNYFNFLSHKRENKSYSEKYSISQFQKFFQFSAKMKRIHWFNLGYARSIRTI